MNSLSPLSSRGHAADPVRGPKQVVIVGGGFGGLETAKRLGKAAVKVTLVDRHNYHLFQPLLYQVATGGLSPANIATPLRSIVRRQSNCEVLMGEVIDFDIANKQLILEGAEIDYDYLVVAAGATHSYFGNDQWQSVAPGLKTIGDAAEIRRRVYGAFEAAERVKDLDLRAALLTFVVVGGGPTGVELAGALSEIARHTLKSDFRKIRPEHSRIILVEAGPNVLSHYPDELRTRAKKDIEDLGIEVRTQTRVVEITEDFVRLSCHPSPATRTAGRTSGQTDPTESPDVEEVIQTRTVLWGAGVQASPLARRLADAVHVRHDRAGRIPVTGSLNIEGHDEIFVIGDMAVSLDQDGKPHPGLASVAIQQGHYVAERISSITADKTVTTPTPFHYKDYGTMATIGRAKAVAELGSRQFTGFFAWMLWLFVHLMLIVQFQNRVLILFQWAWNYTTFNRSNRLILGKPPVIADREKTVDVNKKSA